MFRWLGVAAVSLVLVLAAPSGEAAAAGAPRVGFWTGQSTIGCLSVDVTTCPRDLSAYTPAVWSALADTGGELYIDLTYGSDFGPVAPGANARTDGLELVRQANAHGVPVKAWLIAPLGHGTFANEDNADFFDDAVHAIVPWIHDNGLVIDEVVLDLELPVGYQAVIDATDPVQLVTTHAPIDPAHQCAALRQYADTITWAHHQGMPVGGSPMPFLVDDIADGDMALSDAIDAAPIVPTGFDAVYVQAYRTYSNAGADYVAGYFDQMQQLFGTAGQVSLGDTSMSTAPYTQLPALVDDVRLLAAMGASAIPIFSLEGTVKAYGADGVRQIVSAAASPMSADERTAAAHTTTQTGLTRGFFATLDETASSISLAANPWPGGCGGVAADPLRSTSAAVDGTTTAARAEVVPATNGEATPTLPATGADRDPDLALAAVAIALALRMGARRTSMRPFGR